MVTCEACGSDEIDLARTLNDGRKELVCTDCGHKWVRGEAGRRADRSASVTGLVDITTLSDADPSWGLAQRCIRGAIAEGRRFGTPSDNKPFLVQTLDNDGVVLLLAEQHPIRIGWPIWEGALDLIRRRGPLRIGGGFSVEGETGTLDGYLKQFVSRLIAGWVAVVLEQAGLVRINRDRPATIRLTEQAVAALREREP